MDSDPPRYLWLDLETYSEVKLPDTGVYPYAEHPSTEILLFAYAIDDEPAKVWDMTDGSPMPRDLYHALIDYGFRKVAHNSNFDRNVIAKNKRIGEELDMPKGRPYGIPIEQWEDTMVIAYTLGLRGRLELLMVDLGEDQDFGKIKDGKRLVSMFCMPQKATKKQPYKRRTRETDPEDWQRFVEYARRDVEAMRKAYHMMPQLVIGRHTEVGRRELALWHLSESINDYGMKVDTALAEKAIQLVDEETDRLNKRIEELTGGLADAHTKRDVIIGWAKSRGVELKSYGKEDIIDALKQDMPDDVRKVLEIRQNIGRTSTSKYTALLNTVCRDGRLRGGIQYYAAMRTGRYGGRKFQPQNLPHPSIKNTDTGAEAILSDVVDALYDDPIGVAVSCIRSAIVADEGHSLVVSDLSNIEGRVLPWLAGEVWKLEAFRAYDKGEGPDLYKVAYHKSFGTPFEQIGKAERQIGKYQELSLGYQGGVGAFYKQAKKFGTDMMDIYNLVIERANSNQIEKAEYIVEWIRANRTDLAHLSDQEIIGVDIVKQMWREAHPKIVQFWYDLEEMVRLAIENEGQAFAAGSLNRIKAIRRKYKALDFLLIRLPSGRVLVYRSPDITDTGSIIYMNADNNRWVKSDLYGGKIAENVTQAVARDVLTYNMPRIQATEMNIIGTVHDEVVTEVMDEAVDLDRLNKLMAFNPPWANGLPLAADGYVAKRYRKD